MIDSKTIESQLKNTLTETDLPLGKKYRGKVRDVYTTDERMIMITTDRQSAFDRILASVPFKGSVLTMTSKFWFDSTEDIIPNHVISMPDPNVMICRKLKVFPVEVVVRGYITGVRGTSLWTAYERGEREFCGKILPEGLRKNQKLDKAIITPTTKSDEHDEKISAEQIVQRGLMKQEEWDFVSAKALKLFARGTEVSRKNGLILVDTKYEFGHDEDGNIYLVDEIHTPDSSRFWIEKSYGESFASGEEPENIDKEFLRLWFKKNCDPYKDAVLPEAPKELVVELSRRYIMLYEMITGKEFTFVEGDIGERIEKNLRKAGFI